MRRARVAWVCAALAALCGCSGLGTNGLGTDGPPTRMLSQPPSEAALERHILTVAKTVKWFGMLEASPVRQAHPLAPADWIVCAQSGARDLSPSMALFFNGDTMVHVRTAVTLDDCIRVPYAPVAAVAPPSSAGAPLAEPSSLPTPELVGAPPARGPLVLRP